ncbi:TPM domain-containing protein [Rubrivirga sp.]|uniref:TPM domain-containing protein n=1 Tax=Rubrivirga sp. TaxID=1885344 RepID=UPI003B51F826
MRHLTGLTLAILLVTGCGDGGDSGGDAIAAAQIAGTLRACSYDGEGVAFEEGGEAPQACRDMVAEIMTFVGLPQNFEVMEADVPNAAAVIAVDESQQPRRLIGFNPDFIRLVRDETGGNDWGPVSVMAHEIGHHLAGHTIQRGGSQPPMELESDKFSGFVLYQMGAGLSDAQAAMQALAPEGRSPTHPDRADRLAAIAEGWNQACAQAGGDCASGQPASGATSRSAPRTASRPDAPAPRPSAGASPNAASRDTASRPATSRPSPSASRPSAPPASQPSPRTTPNAPARPAGRADMLPASGSIPSKGLQFVYDEYGLLDPAIRQSHEAAMRQHAQATGVEIVTVVTRDLQGMSAEDFGWAMLRQLRVGQLDVGSGAVLVVAPEAGQAAAVLGPGVALEVDAEQKTEQLERWISVGWPNCQRGSGCGTWTDNLFGAADHVRRDTDDWGWEIRYQSFQGLFDAAASAREARLGGGPDNPTWRALANVSGRVVALDPAPGGRDPFVNDVKLEGRRAVHVETEGGFETVMYFDPEVEAIMPGGPLQAGKAYTFVVREGGLSANRDDTQHLDLISYTLAE